MKYKFKDIDSFSSSSQSEDEPDQLEPLNFKDRVPLRKRDFIMCDKQLFYDRKYETRMRRVAGWMLAAWFLICLIGFGLIYLSVGVIGRVQLADAVISTLKFLAIVFSSLCVIFACCCWWLHRPKSYTIRVVMSAGDVHGMIYHQQAKVKLYLLHKGVFQRAKLPVKQIKELGIDELYHSIKHKKSGGHAIRKRVMLNSRLTDELMNTSRVTMCVEKQVLDQRIDQVVVGHEFNDREFNEMESILGSYENDCPLANSQMLNKVDRRNRTKFAESLRGFL